MKTLRSYEFATFRTTMPSASVSEDFDWLWKTRLYNHSECQDLLTQTHSTALHMTWIFTLVSQSLEICIQYSVSQPWVLPTFCPSTVKVYTECNFVLKHTSCLFSIFNQNSSYYNVWIQKSSVMLHSTAEWIVPNVSCDHSEKKRSFFYNFKKSDAMDKRNVKQVSLLWPCPDHVHTSWGHSESKYHMILHSYGALWTGNCVTIYTGEAENCRDTRVNWK